MKLEQGLPDRNSKRVCGGSGKVIDADRLIAVLLYVVPVAGLAAFKNTDFAAARADRRRELLTGMSPGHITDTPARSHAALYRG